MASHTSVVARQRSGSGFVLSQMRLSVPGCPELVSTAIVLSSPLTVFLVHPDNDIARQGFMMPSSFLETIGELLQNASSSLNLSLKGSLPGRPPGFPPSYLME